MSQLLRNPDVVLREEDEDGALLFNPDTNQVRVLNATAVFLWHLCDGSKGVPDMVAALKTQFEGVPEKEAEDHVKSFMDDMTANGFIGVAEEEKK
jgi:SynChlorMet cassette protein ScmD